MSEEILKALMHLFAIIAKQDDGVNSNELAFVKNFLTSQLNDEVVNEYLSLFYKYAKLDENGNPIEGKDGKKKLTSVRDSVRILGICEKINKTINQEQKVIVLVRIFELVNADRKFTDQRMEIINTVAEVFNLSSEEFKKIKDFVIENDPEIFGKYPNVLIINDHEGDNYSDAKHIISEKLDGNIYILRVSSVDLYFLKYTGKEELYLNGMGLSNRSIYLFANGSAIRLPKGKPIYYSDVVSRFLEDFTESKISYECKNLSYKFPNGTIGVKNINLAEAHGKLVAIMGVSGAGKTTLMNVLAGIEKPCDGEVLINGINLHKNKNAFEGVIGLVPQDDLLIEELTVFQNLFFNAKLCFKDKSDQEIRVLVDNTLDKLGLLDFKDLTVGSPINKVISGGQRKRLNIALEIIREPSILFLDEPTSGLSSRDSENVMDLLRELSLKGKLIFVVIHQPSSDIYKMFDNVLLLDVGGYMIYYGNPVEAVMYFKRMDAQINSEVGECPTCGSVNPELIFNIVEARVVDEFGKYTDKRKVSAPKWEELYKENVALEQHVDVVKEKPVKTLNIPNWIKQVNIYTVRDFLSKISNKEYIILNLLEAPVLGFILSYIIRYSTDPESNTYIFRENENIPIYIFMAIIVALFLGLTVSAEEIFRDRKLIKRESFLNLSRSSYLVSKIIILFTLSALQAFLFTIIANNILGIKDMTLQYWFALFSTAACANLLGLNISASFNSVVTIYIIIPLIMIPMMVLSGAMFEFDKLNHTISSVKKVPVIAELMPTKWTYEALMVNQFKNNKYQQALFDEEKQISQADFKQVYLIPELESKLNECIDDVLKNNEITDTEDNLILLKNEIQKELQDVEQVSFDALNKINPEDFNSQVAVKVQEYLDKLKGYYGEIFNKANTIKEKKIDYWLKNAPEVYQQTRNDYYNESIADIVKKVFEKNKMIERDNELIQQVDPIYKDPQASGYLNFRSHFYAPQKHFAGHFFDTYNFNMVIIWCFTLLLYIALYYKLLSGLLNLPNRFKKNK